MRRLELCLVLCAVATTISLVGRSVALEPEVRCEAGKNKIAGQYASCRQKAVRVALKRGLAPDYRRCDDKFFDKWVKEERKALAVNRYCPDGID